MGEHTRAGSLCTVRSPPPTLLPTRCHSGCTGSPFSGLHKSQIGVVGGSPEARWLRSLPIWSLSPSAPALLASSSASGRTSGSSLSISPPPPTAPTPLPPAPEEAGSLFSSTGSFCPGTLASQSAGSVVGEGEDSVCTRGSRLCNSASWRGSCTRLRFRFCFRFSVKPALRSS